MEAIRAMSAIMLMKAMMAIKCYQMP